MKLRKIALYNSAGDIRTIDFHDGLNVITGDSATGKSALLDIVEFCLGRDTFLMPVGPITETVVWYAVVVDLASVSAFVARPAPRRGRASTSQAMLELGVDIEPLEFETLVANTDSKTVREELGRMIGIEENSTDPGDDAQRHAMAANLGHAVLLCLQGQSEIADRDFLFHRQGEEGLTKAIQDSLPYFLGAVPSDQAIQRQRLTVARRDLRRAEQDLRRAEGANQEMEVNLRSLVTQAVAAGLLPAEPDGGLAEGLDALREAASAPVSEAPRDDEDAVRIRELSRRRDELRAELRSAGEERGLLESLDSDEASYEAVVGQQLSRLRSLELLGDDDSDGSSCPICGSQLSDEDPHVTELREVAADLSSRVGVFDGQPPRRRVALETLSERTEEIRQNLRAIEEAVQALRGGQSLAEDARRAAAMQLFVQGRIQQYLDTTQAAEDVQLYQFRTAAELRRAEVDRLEALLDPEEERDQLTSRLSIIGEDMTEWARQLDLEHSQDRVRLDLRRLTVVADTSAGPAALNRIGSAANWIGYHLVAHLALHKYFREQGRPVPHFLMIDQLTQAYYPTDTAEWSGEPMTDTDRDAVRALYGLIRQAVDEMGQSMQVIVCDHAFLVDDWFEQSIVENWRDGRHLIPDSWIPSR